MHNNLRFKFVFMTGNGFLDALASFAFKLSVMINWYFFSSLYFQSVCTVSTVSTVSTSEPSPSSGRLSIIFWPGQSRDTLSLFPSDSDYFQEPTSTALSLVTGQEPMMLLNIVKSLFLQFFKSVNPSSCQLKWGNI